MNTTRDVGSLCVIFPLQSLDTCTDHLFSFLTACDSSHPWRVSNWLIPTKVPNLSANSQKKWPPSSVWSRADTHLRQCLSPRPWMSSFQCYKFVVFMSYEGPCAEMCDSQENEIIFYKSNIFTWFKIQWRCSLIFIIHHFYYFKKGNMHKHILTPLPPSHLPSATQIPSLLLRPWMDWSEPFWLFIDRLAL